MSVDELIDALGGPTVVALSLGIGQNAVSNWRNRGFPAWAHAHIKRLCLDRGIKPGEEVFETAPPRRLKARAA